MHGCCERKKYLSESFNSGEHIIIGDGNINIKYPPVVLHFSDGDKYSNNVKFTLENGIEVTFGQIIALAGDIFATLNPISDGIDLADKQNRFIEAFNTLNKSTGNTYGSATFEVPNILKIMNNEIDMINNSIRNNTLPSNNYILKGHDNDIAYNMATGGGNQMVKNVLDGTSLSVFSLLPQGRYLQIAGVNWDHFSQGDNAWNAYFTGHTLAMTTAANAGLTNNIPLLNSAYVIEAFACHFLTDMFASGHIRVPRKELQYGTGTSSWYWDVTLAGIMSSAMHGEDNKTGLKVANNACYNKYSNVPCKIWTAYGDNYFSDPSNKENRKMINKTLQISVDEIWKSFINKEPVISTVYEYIPNYDLTKIIPGTENNKEDMIIGGNMSYLGYCNPNSCESELGPEWYMTGTTNKGCYYGNKNICSRNTTNPVPMYRYDKINNLLWKRSKNNTMVTVDSQIASLNM